MFRTELHSAFLLLTSSLALATSAQAADVATVALDVTAARSSLVSDGIEVEFRVTGTGLNNGTLTQPITGALPITLQKVGADLVLTDEFANMSELNTFLPSGSYLLRVNNDTIEATLAYARPAVPSPAISSPNAGDTVAPGSVEVEFTACPVCNLSGDSVAAELEDDAQASLDTETLTAAATSWVPQGVAGALELPEDASFVARVTHTAHREATVPVTDDDDNLVFSHDFVQSDEIGFDTGFSRPEGHVCIAANYTAPPLGCAIVTDPLLQVLDTTGAFATQVAGHDLEITVSVAANGALSGSATADLDDNGSLETSSTPLKGRLSGKLGELRSLLAFALNNSALPAKLKLSQSDRLSIPDATIASTLRASGAIAGTKIKERTSTSGALPFTPHGWLLEFDVGAGAAVQNALLTLESGRSFALTGKTKFKLSSGRSRVKLRSTPKGVRIGLRKVRFDDSTSPVGVTGGGLRVRVLGQSAKKLLP